MDMIANNNIFQLYITDDSIRSLPVELARCVTHNFERKEEFDHYFLRNDEIHDFIKSEFGGDVVYAYEKLRPYAYRADLVRYCLIYKYGGWYFDVSVKINNLPTVVGSHKYVVFREPPAAGDVSYGVNNAAFYSESGQLFLEHAILTVIDNCKRNYYGSNCLNVTGPGVFGKMISQYGNHEDGLVGDYIQLTPAHPRKNMAFVLPSGDIAAWGKSTAGSLNGISLNSLGAVGTNSYAHMWAGKDIYN